MKWKVSVPIGIADTYVVEAEDAKEALSKTYDYVFNGGYEGEPEETYREVEDSAYWYAECLESED